MRPLRESRRSLTLVAVLGVGLFALLTSCVPAVSNPASPLASSLPDYHPALPSVSTPSGNVVITGVESLTSNLIAPNLTIAEGAVLATNGFSIVVSGTFDNGGTIVTGGAPSETLTSSLGGSGGGAQSLNYCVDDENGTSTLAPGGALSCSNSENGGAGSSPTAPTLNASLLASWYATGMQSYLAGGAGGAVQGYIAAGAGANGLYIQAQTLIAGTIDATGGAGEGTCSGIGLSGGGGGGTVILAYGTGVYGTLDLSATGGAGAPSCEGNVASGAGGDGQLVLFSYGSSPPVAAGAGSPGSHGAPGGSASLVPRSGSGSSFRLSSTELPIVVLAGALIVVTAALVGRRRHRGALNPARPSER